jgi:hypothetical protein
VESFLSCTFLPVSKARTNIICLLRQCKYIKEEKLIPILWTLHRFQWKIGIYFYKNKIKLVGILHRLQCILIHLIMIYKQKLNIVITIISGACWH